MEIEIHKALPQDAQAILNYLKQVGSETDNLTFGAEGMPISVEDEANYLSALCTSQHSVMLVAKKAGQIVGVAGFTGNTRERMKHRGELAISVLRSEWGAGIGSRLMETIISFARDVAKAEIISLEVRRDNERAIRLYEKYGFKKIGKFKGFFKINGEFVDFDLMNLYL